jgi:CDGSH iron-sulfur domain-containing protein 3
MTEPKIAQAFPYFIDVEKGKTYYWCACGKSENQPFCDGTHSGSEFTPEPFVSEKDKKVMFCGCKRSKKGAICDGSHNKL